MSIYYYSIMNNFFGFSIMALAGEGSAYFLDALKKSNRYEVYYPKGEYEEDNPLFNHKKFFVNNAEKVTSWDGMKDSEVISGRLCDCSKKLIYKAEKSFEKIWKFNLLYDTDIILSVDDFDTCVLFA